MATTVKVKSGRVSRSRLAPEEEGEERGGRGKGEGEERGGRGKGRERKEEGEERGGRREVNSSRQERTHILSPLATVTMPVLKSILNRSELVPSSLYRTREFCVFGSSGSTASMRVVVPLISCEA